MRKESFEDVKSNVILIIAIMVFLFTFCFVMYTGILDDGKMDINTSYEINTGNSSISKKLQNIIPYIGLVDTSYKTAYQDSLSTIESISNSVYLAKAYLNSGYNDEKRLLNQLNNMYGDSIFIVNESFYVNGSEYCKFNSEEREYDCGKIKNNDKKYLANREITNINISGDNYYLTENIIFYSSEIVGDEFGYEIYSDGTYNSVIDRFTSNDVELANITFDEYLRNNYKENSNIYRSKFVVNNSNYNWINTERLK